MSHDSSTHPVRRTPLPAAQRIEAVLEHFAITVTRDEMQRLVGYGAPGLVCDVVEMFGALGGQFTAAGIEREVRRLVQRRVNQGRRS